MSKYFPLIFIITIIITITSIQPWSVTSWTLWPSRYWVSIQNGLSKDILDVHCRMLLGKKYGNDFGLMHLPSKANFSTNFKTRVWTKVFCECNMTWPKHGRLDKFYAFENDQGFVDNMCGGHHCDWQGADDGIYMFNWKKGKLIKVGEWDKL